jgi:hypothetical protein
MVILLSKIKSLTKMNQMDVVPYCKICSKQKKTEQEHFSCLTSYIIAYEKMNINWRISSRCEGNDHPFESYMTLWMKKL